LALSKRLERSLVEKGYLIWSHFIIIYSWEALTNYWECLLIHTKGWPFAWKACIVRRLSILPTLGAKNRILSFIFATIWHFSNVEKLQVEKYSSMQRSPPDRYHFILAEERCILDKKIYGSQ
jgi:hypothetical protein